jgi:hypothetical protein
VELAAIESQIRELKSLLFLNDAQTFTKRKGGGLNGLSPIQTGDIRNVKAGNLGLSEAFFRGEITTKEANAPSERSDIFVSTRQQVTSMRAVIVSSGSHSHFYVDSSTTDAR